MDTIPPSKQFDGVSIVVLVHNLQKIAGEAIIINIPDLHVQAGQIVAIIGTANSGLDTLFKLLIGQIAATSGHIEIAGRAINSKIESVSGLGVVFEQDALYPHMSVKANLQFIARLHRLDRQCVDRVLTEIGLNDHMHVQADKLPSGLRRRLVFGRALLHDPGALILFDPFARCDEGTITLITHLLEQQGDRHKAILILSPNSDHLHFCDQIFTLRHGELSVVEHTEDQVTHTPFRIPVRMDGKVALINPAVVLYITVEEGQVILFTDTEQFDLQFTLTELEERLARSGFFRAHRAYLVNLQRVKDIISYTRDSYNLRLDDPAETRVPLSKNAASQLRKLFDY